MPVKIKNKLFFIIIAVNIIIFSSACKKQLLPELTQSGRNTFGCLINGVLFKPKGSLLKGSLPNAQYGYNSSAAGFSLRIDIENKVDDHLKTMQLNYLSNSELKSGITIPITTGTFEVASANYTDYANDLWSYTTTDKIKGELEISYFDKSTHVVSGTFWFNAVNKQGEKVKVREGRFDIKYQ